MLSWFIFLLFDPSARVFFQSKDVIVCIFSFLFVRFSTRHFDAYSSEK